MPTYQYACTECGERLEAVQSFTDAALTECPTCSGRLRKVFSAVGVVFKGSGFYKTDSRGAPKGEGSSSGADSGGAEGSSTTKAGGAEGGSKADGAGKGGKGGEAAASGKGDSGKGGSSAKGGSGSGGSSSGGSSGSGSGSGSSGSSVPASKTA